jgi:hypothetical protein
MGVSAIFAVGAFRRLRHFFSCHLAMHCTYELEGPVHSLLNGSAGFKKA